MGVPYILAVFRATLAALRSARPTAWERALGVCFLARGMEPVFLFCQLATGRFEAAQKGVQQGRRERELRGVLIEVR